MIIGIAILLLSIVGAVLGQTFEVASVKLSSLDANSTSGIKTGHGRLDAHNVTLKRCIMGAYAVGPHQISGGPDWLDFDRFDILAKSDQPVDDDGALMAMLRTLLGERFKLAIRRETRPMTAFVLQVAKNGPKMEKAAPGESGTNTTNNNTGVTVDAHHTNMDALARVLARSLDLPVVNGTGLDGIFNFKLHWVPDNARPAMEGVSIFTAVQEQLGLRLRSEKTLVEVLVIEHAERPTEN